MNYEKRISALEYTPKRIVHLYFTHFSKNE